MQNVSPFAGTCRILRLTALVCLCALLAQGCASRRDRAQGLAETGGFRPMRLETKDFVLRGWLRPGSGPNLAVYIEGDGFAWVRSNRPSSDPTPTDPVGLRLALADPSRGPVLYLARPCQYVEEADRRGCSVEDWTSARFSARAVAALDEAVSQVEARTRASAVALHGYSGGGAMAALLAARRGDVVFLATVAGNLDHRLWTTRRDDSPLVGSLNPVDTAQATSALPQLHVIGGKDEVVPRALLDSWMGRAKWTRLTRIVLPEADHGGPWEGAWPGLLRQTRPF